MVGGEISFYCFISLYYGVIVLLLLEQNVDDGQYVYNEGSNDGCSGKDSRNFHPRMPHHHYPATVHPDEATISNSYASGGAMMNHHLSAAGMTLPEANMMHYQQQYRMQQQPQHQMMPNTQQQMPIVPWPYHQQIMMGQQQLMFPQQLQQGYMPLLNQQQHPMMG